MSVDVAIVGYTTQNGAVNAFTKRAGDDAAWTSEVAFVEHHRSGRVALSGTFVGHYLDVDEADHVSQPGAAEGALTGVLAGLVFGPPGWAAGFVVGGIIGAEAGKPTEVEDAPAIVVDELRAAVPLGGSAIVLVAAPDHVEEMLVALEGTDGQVTRCSLSDAEQAVLESALSGTPAARIGAIEPGEETRP